MLLELSHYGMSHKISLTASYRVLMIKLTPHTTLPKLSLTQGAAS